MYSSLESSSLSIASTHIDSTDPHLIILGLLTLFTINLVLHSHSEYHKSEKKFSIPPPLQLLLSSLSTNTFSITQARNLNITLDTSSSFLVPLHPIHGLFLSFYDCSAPPIYLISPVPTAMFLFRPPYSLIYTIDLVLPAVVACGISIPSCHYLPCS